MRFSREIERTPPKKPQSLWQGRGEPPSGKECDNESWAGNAKRTNVFVFGMLIEHGFIVDQALAEIDRTSRSARSSARACKLNYARRYARINEELAGGGALAWITRNDR